jgi:hypothetical protein
MERIKNKIVGYGELKFERYDNGKNNGAGIRAKLDYKNISPYTIIGLLKTTIENIEKKLNPADEIKQK